ncbi:MAG: MFS transporter [Propionibacteriales bacterium]|nr:MFS transporter [Propionibacteriales bacterium]
MFTAYRHVLARPGALSFSGAGFVARLPISMVTLAIVLLIVDRAGSYGLAGSVSAAYMMAAAASSPVLARLIDRLGQRRVLVPGIVGFAVGLAGLVVSVELDWPVPLPHLLAAAAGACYPPVGACVRSRWTNLLGPGRALHTAFSFEAVVDETIFIVGPVLVTVLATSVHPMAGVGAVAVCAVIGGWWFTILRATEPQVAEASDQPVTRPPLGWHWLLPMIAVSVCLGSLFGAIEVATVAFADENGRPALTGLLLAIYAAGSLIAGVATGMLSSDPAATLLRYRVGSAAIAAAMIPLPFINHPGLLAVVLFLGGFAVSPTLVSLVSLVEAHVPPSRLTEGITWVMTGIGLGIAPGAAIAGRLIDQYGAGTAYWVSFGSGLLAAGLTWWSGGNQSTPGPAVDDIDKGGTRERRTSASSSGHLRFQGEPQGASDMRMQTISAFVWSGRRRRTD